MKRASIVIAIGLVCGNAYCALMTWGVGAPLGGSGEVRYKDGSLVALNSDWLVELVNADTEQVLYSTTDGFNIQQGIFFHTCETDAGWNGLNVKTVIFDSNTKETAGFFAEFSIPTTLSWVDTTPPAPPASLNYDAGEVTAVLGSGPGQWQAIPEPTVAAFIGVFGGGLIVTRRLFSKKA